LDKSRELVLQHPLSIELLRDIAISCWGILWQTKIGDGATAFRLDEVEVPSTVIGYLFEKLFARELAARLPTDWRGGQSKEEKDIVCLSDPRFSTEMKTSGQLGLKIFGNRSYGQKTEDALVSKPEKSGYYITVNFYKKALSLIRFGWIDVSDWKPQKSETGQAASLVPEVYESKLLEIPGRYRLSAPVGVMEGIGKKTAETFAEDGILTIYDLINYEGSSGPIQKFREMARAKFVAEI
ncbi:MAG: hypothetical protein QOH51_2534, partial [Acidobacteriota bacterium]|nr:hypothetical protein [Acidobacteriota bacterium]